MSTGDDYEAENDPDTAMSDQTTEDTESNPEVIEPTESSGHEQTVNVQFATSTIELQTEANGEPPSAEGTSGQLSEETTKNISKPGGATDESTESPQQLSSDLPAEEGNSEAAKRRKRSIEIAI